MAEADTLYCRLNSRGRKQFKDVQKTAFEENWSGDFGKIGLPAHKAALEGNVDCLRDLFVARLDDAVPSRDVNGATPLHLAVKANRVETLKWLLRYTDLSQLTTAKQGETAAHVAAAQSHIECMKALLNTNEVKNALCTFVDNSGYTPLHLAIVKQRNECVKYLVNELGLKSVNAVNESGVTAAHVAASSGNVEVLKLFSGKYKKLLTQEAPDGTSPVYFAAQEGRLEALRFLHTKAKCLLDVPSSDGLMPIHAAAQCGHTNIIKFIVSKLGNSAIFECTPDGASPLHFAVATGKVDTARWLINSDVTGRLVTKADKNGDTPAHDAADNGKTEALKLLIENGADIYTINKEGQTPYSLALSGQNTDTAQFIMAHASKSPQKEDEQGPSQINILAMKEAEEIPVDFGSPISVAPKLDQQQQDNGYSPAPKSLSPQGYKPAPQSMGKQKEGPSPSKKAGKDKKEEKAAKEGRFKKSSKKEKDKGKKTSPNHFLGSSNPTFQSFDRKTSNITPSPATGDDGPLEISDITIFKSEPQENSQYEPAPQTMEQHYVPKPPPSSDGSDIVVRYKESDFDVPLTSDYATINEIAMVKERKEKKKAKRTSKSIQESLKPDKKQSKTKGSKVPDTAFQGSELGFRPQFRSNPLQKRKQQMADIRSPPTPPPTPLTQTDTSVSGEVTQDTEEDEDEDGANPYDIYAKPDPEVVKRKALKRKQEELLLQQSANKKLLDDALSDLAKEEEPPPIPERNFDIEQEEDEKEIARSQPSFEEPDLNAPIDPQQDEEEHSPKPQYGNVLRKWPPANVEPQLEKRPVEENRMSKPVAGTSVLRKWPMTQEDQEKPKAEIVTPSKEMGAGGRKIKKKWPPDPEDVEETEAVVPAPESTVEETKPKEDEQPPSQVQQQDESARPSYYPQLRKTGQVKGKSTDTTEQHSGAGEELKSIFRKREKKHSDT